jgi:8-oxo-dGTP pyrophosphatase MutT (NUDIX family)
LLPAATSFLLLFSFASQPYGLSCSANVVKECWEEAGVPNQLAAAATAVGFVSYVSMSEEGLKPDVLFCYDLQLPEDFVPQPQDGEVRQRCV